MGEEVRLARVSLHMWEEPVISGERGSGTVFFCGCPLQCVYCQNHKIALGATGKAVKIEELADYFLKLQEHGANNLNLVTPTHYTLQIREALVLAKKQGLTLPVVYNTSGYEKVETLKLIDGLVDVYLTDFKYCSAKLAGRYSAAPDYFWVASAALEEMVRQIPGMQFQDEKSGKKIHYTGEEEAVMTKGIIVRHLLLPGAVEESKKIIRYLYETYGDKIYISIMNQYTPFGDFEKYPELARKISDEEYEEVIDYAINLGVEQGFIQEGDTAEESFVPDFDIDNILKL